jgi:hypothetical protein
VTHVRNLIDQSSCPATHTVASNQIVCDLNAQSHRSFNQLSRPLLNAKCSMGVCAASPFTSRACQLANQDLQAARNEYVFTLPGSLLTRVTSSGLLKDSRDLPQFLLLTNILLTAVPAAVCLHAFKVESHAVGLLYLLANYTLYLQVGGGAAADSVLQVQQELGAVCMQHAYTSCA